MKVTLIGGLLVNLILFGLLLTAHISYPKMADKIAMLEGQNQKFQAHLETLKKKTASLEELKASRDLLEEHSQLSKGLLSRYVPWSSLLQDFAVFVQERPLWWEKIRIDRTENRKKNQLNNRRKNQVSREPESFYTLGITMYSAGKSVEIPNDLRKDLQDTPFWKKFFQVSGLNDPSYKIVHLPKGVYLENIATEFSIEAPLKGTFDHFEQPK